MSRATFQVPCEQCGTPFHPHYKNKRLTRFCSSECYSLKQSIPVGTKYGRLTSLGLVGADENGRRLTRFACECGNEVETLAKFVRRGTTKSCGCWKSDVAAQRATARNFVHGQANTPEYAAFNHAQRRCNDPENPAYANYGGRGIEFRFNSIEEWLEELGPKPSPELTVDRIDNNGHYERGNVRWATRHTQVHNRRPIRPGLTRKKRTQLT